MESETRVDDLVNRWEEMRDRGTPVMIEELCAGSPDLVAEVRWRIEALQAMDSALDTGADTTHSQERDGDHLGAAADRGPTEVLRATAIYHPQCHHGHGGLGVVFIAHQEELDRTVALKRFRPDKLHDQARRRFLREAAVTARLQHPGIVPIYGLGEDEGGPFYTMPLIEGQTLQQAIDTFHGDESLLRDPGRRGLRFRGLLQQFIAVCNTMAYAHDRGVVHRDLKPSNLMLGPYGETLVMDWGLAKRFGADDAAGDAGADPTSPGPSPGDVTATGEVLGTPQYMSPEQAKGEPAGPAGDIFSLGLVLYAILTGKPAFEESSFRGPDRLKAVREASIVTPRRRDPRLPRALEAICLKALSARAGDRYSSARTLADDLTRWLADEPVTACREPIHARARRWGRRHRTSVTAAMVALVAVAIGLGAVAAVQARANERLEKVGDERAQALEETRLAQGRTGAALERSEESRKQAEAVSEFLVEAFRSPDPSVDDKDMKVADVLDRASTRLDTEFAGSRAIRGVLHDALGQTYSGLGSYDKAVNQHTKASDMFDAALGPDHPNTLISRSNLADAYVKAGRLDKAIPIHEEVLERRKAILGDDHPDSIASRSNLAIAYARAGRLSEAIPLAKEALRRGEAVLGPDHPATLTSRHNLGTAYFEAGRSSEAIPLLEEALKRREAILGPDRPDTLASRNNLAIAYARAGRLSDAIRLDEATVKLKEAKLGPDHPDTLATCTNLANDYRKDGRLAQAITLQERTLSRCRAGLGRDHPLTLKISNNLALAYHEAGRLSEAIPLNRATLELEEAKLGPDHPETLTTCTNLANDYHRDGQLPRSIALYERTLNRSRKKVGLDHPLTLAISSNLAVVYQDAGRLPEAIDLDERTLGLREAKLGPDHPETLMSRINLALVYLEADRLSEMIALHETTLRRIEARFGRDHRFTLVSRIALAAAYAKLGRWAEAEGINRDLLDRIRQQFGPESAELAEGLAALGHVLLDQSRWSEAEPFLRSALAIREKATPDVWRRYDAMSLLGLALLGQGLHAEAEPMILGGYEGMKGREAQLKPSDRPGLCEAAMRVVRLYEDSGQPEKADAWKLKVGMRDLPTDVFSQP